VSTIKTDFGAGGAGLTPASGDPNLAAALRDAADDIELLRAAIAGICAKLDADATVTDTNYGALFGVLAGAIKTKKG
jgi:hypothetical protein